MFTYSNDEYLGDPKFFRIAHCSPIESNMRSKSCEFMSAINRNPKMRRQKPSIVARDLYMPPSVRIQVLTMREYAG